MTQELRKLAEAATQGPWIAAGPSYGESLPVLLNCVVVEEDDGDTDDVCRDVLTSEDALYIAAANPAAILALLDRLEKAEKDAARWNYAVEIGGNQTMNWLDVYDDWDGDGDFTAQIDRAMEASK